MTVAVPRPDRILLAYRIVAIVVSTGFAILCVVGLPLKYIGNESAVVQVVGPLHGFLYVLYLLLVLQLTLRERWPLPFAVLVALAGTIPFAGFFAERIVNRRVRARAAGPVVPR